MPTRAFLVILALLLWSIGCQPEEPSGKAQRPPLQADMQPVEVQVMRPIRKDLAYTVKPWQHAPLYQTTLYAKVSGYLKWIGPDKGDPVKKGQVVSIIDAPEIEEQYLQAAADCKIKKITFERLKNVWKESSDVIAKQDVDVAEAAYEGARTLMQQRRSARLRRRSGPPTTAPSLPVLPIQGP